MSGTITITDSGAAFNLADGDSVIITGSTDTITLGSNVTVTVQDSGDSLNASGANDTVTTATTAACTTVSFTNGGTVNMKGAASSATINAQTISDIDAIYNAVLDRDLTPDDMASVQMVLQSGGSLGDLQAQLAHSDEALADMASTYAAVASDANLALLDAQPQSSFQVPSGGGAPTQAEFAAFADATATSYGAPIALFSVDPLSGAETELGDTSITNLLAELPVLETEANGVNLGLQLADGTQVQFASTARLATFLYALAVQQMQATSFITDMAMQRLQSRPSIKARPSTVAASHDLH